MINLAFSEDDLTLLINILNQPHLAQTVHLSAFISLIQTQAAPQIKAKEEEKAKNADGVPSELEEKNWLTTSLDNS